GVSSVLMQIDGGDWVAAAPTTIDEGTHEIRVRAFDSAGNQSDTTQRTVKVDLSQPSATVASFPPAPNDPGWYRQTPWISESTHDGPTGSGSDGATFTYDGAGPASYLLQIPIDDGQHDVVMTPRDRAGFTGPSVPTHFRIDQTPPSVTLSSTAPS